MQILELAAPPDPAQLDDVRTLVREYAAMPHSAVLWTSSATDIAQLPAPFLPPRGGLLLVRDDDGTPIACGAWVPTADAGVAEIKRVYVRPAVRGRGVGEAIVRALMARAAETGHTRVILDTDRTLLAAQALYRRLGFTEIAQFRPQNGDRTVCFGRDVGPVAPG